MEALVAKGLAAYPQSDLDRLRQQGNGTVEAEKARLREASRQFEALFSYYLLKSMRETIPESSDKNQGMGGGFGKDIFTQMFDMEISRKMASSGKSSMSEMLYRSLERVIETQFGEGLKDKISGPIPLGLKKADPIPIYRQIARPLPKSVPTPLTRKATSLPLQRKMDITDSSDPIMRKYGEEIERTARATGLDPALIYAVIRHESAGDAKAVSPKGAKGLMQLIDSTAAQYDVRNVFRPSENIRAGSRYLKDLVDRFGDLKLALAAYNAGPGNVTKYGGMPPFRETQEYVGRVLDTLNTMRSRFSQPEPKAIGQKADK